MFGVPFEPAFNTWTEDQCPSAQTSHSQFPAHTISESTSRLNGGHDQSQIYSILGQFNLERSYNRAWSMRAPHHDVPSFGFHCFYQNKTTKKAILSDQEKITFRFSFRTVALLLILEHCTGAVKSATLKIDTTLFPLTAQSIASIS